MREPTYFLLLALSDGPLYGYGIAKRAEELSDGSVKLTAGTLYGALDRLVAGGQIVVDHEEVIEGRRRRYYKMTANGDHELIEEVARMRAAVSVADRIVGPGTAGASA